MIAYRDFLNKKKFNIESYGFDVEVDYLNKKLFPFQKDIIRWSLKKGRSCIFADCGLGKTPMQLEWANQIHKKTKEGILILAPLAVSKQTKREGEKFGIEVLGKKQQTLPGNLSIAEGFFV